MWSAVVYSLPSHKEFRFLLPALQLAMPYAGVALESLAQCSRPEWSTTHSISGGQPQPVVSETHAAPASEASSATVCPLLVLKVAVIGGSSPAPATAATETAGVVSRSHPRQLLRQDTATATGTTSAVHGRVIDATPNVCDMSGRPQRWRFWRMGYIAALAAVAAQLPAALYFGLRHQRCACVRLISHKL